MDTVARSNKSRILLLQRSDCNKTLKRDDLPTFAHPTRYISPKRKQKLKIIL